MTRKIGCIEIPVSDINRSVAFYEKMLGLKKTYEHPVWTSFDVDGVSFALALTGTKKGEKDTKPCTSCELCVHRYASGMMKHEKDTPSAISLIYLAVDNLDELHKNLKEQGVTFITDPKEQAWGGRTAVMLDPDKNIIVLTQA